MTRHGLDLATVVERVDEAITAVNDGVDRARALHEQLDGCVGGSEVLGDDEALVRLEFEGEAAVGDVADLRAAAQEWYEVAVGLTRTHDLRMEDVRVLGGGRGSLVLDLATPEVVAVTLGAILAAGLRATEKILRIRLLAAQARGQEIANDAAARQFDRQASELEEEAVESVVEEIASAHGLKGENRGEDENALAKAVRLVINFQTRGGHVDCVLPAVEEVDEEGDKEPTGRHAELREVFSEVRTLEARLRELGRGEDTAEGA